MEIEIGSSFFAGLVAGVAMAVAVFGIRQIRNRQRLSSAEEQIEMIMEHININEDHRRNPRRTGARHD